MRPCRPAYSVQAKPRSASATSIGVLGQTGTKAPVFDKNTTYTAGVVGASRDTTGVLGFSQTDNGVFGISSAAGTGVFGRSNSGFGVAGRSELNPGVTGFSTNSTGVAGTAGASGPVPGMLPTTAGVLGDSDALPGVLGTSNNAVGVAGYSKNAIGVYGETGAAGAYAGFFRGNLYVTGQIFAVIKDAIVPFSDGSHRLMHCMESPEHWFEDFGAARLKRGRAVVKLDADFAKTIRTGDYRVFITPEGDCGGLYIKSKRGEGFEVRELQGGTSNVAFSYRIVGRRKDITAHRRFARIDIKPPMLSAPRTARRRRSAC